MRASALVCSLVCLDVASGCSSTTEDIASSLKSGSGGTPASSAVGAGGLMDDSGGPPPAVGLDGMHVGGEAGGGAAVRATYLEPALGAEWWARVAPSAERPLHDPFDRSPTDGPASPQKPWPPANARVVSAEQPRASCPRAEIRAWVAEEEQRVVPGAELLTYHWQAARERVPRLGTGVDRVLMARSTAARGMVSRFVEVSAGSSGAAGLVGWEWYRHVGDVDVFCGRAAELGCRNASWTENWAWCEIEPAQPVSWDAVVQALDAAGAWDLEARVPEGWGRFEHFLGRPPRGLPGGIVTGRSLWLTTLRAGEATHFGVSSRSPIEDSDFARTMVAVSEALPWGE